MSKRFVGQVTAGILGHLYQELGLHPQLGNIRKAQRTTDGPRVVALTVAVNPRYERQIRAMAGQLSMAARLDGESTIRVVRGVRGTLRFEVPKPESLWYPVHLSGLRRGRGVKVALGIDGDHRPTRLAFDDPLTPHLLTAGATGCGKTNSLRVLLVNLVQGNSPNRVRLLLVDVAKAGRAFDPFVSVPHLEHNVITRDVEALQALSWAVAEMGRRAQARAQNPARLFVVIDEAQAILDREEFVSLVGQVASVGREYGVHLVLATQNPTAAMLGTTSIKRNLTTRLVGRVTDAAGANVAAGVPDSGAQYLTGPGDLLLITPSGGVQRITGALARERDYAELPRSETVGSLDLAQFEDAEHVIEQASLPKQPGRKMEAHTNEMIALSLTGMGVKRLMDRFSMGKARSRRLRDDARAILAHLNGAGFDVVGGTEIGGTESKDIPPDGYTLGEGVAIQTPENSPHPGALRSTLCTATGRAASVPVDDYEPDGGWLEL